MIHATQRQAGTVLFITDPRHVDTLAVDKQGETPGKLAKRLGVSTQDLLELNATRYPGLNGSSKLKVGAELIFRDRTAEPDVFLPTRKIEVCVRTHSTKDLW